MKRTQLRGRLVHGLWRVYRVLIFPVLQGLAGGGSLQGCRHQPSCSEFAMNEVTERGWFRGGIAGLRRIATCHPFQSQ